jgi:RNA polymerase sigma factor (TIGR02999 family)
MAELVNDVEPILAAAAAGDRASLDRLYALLYSELREIAHQHIRRHDQSSSLDTTSLVHESYLRFVKVGAISASSRAHFLAYAAHVMRSVVVDFVRHAQAARRGGGNLHITLNTNLQNSLVSPADDLLRLHDLLNELASVDQRLVSVVEMSYFTSLTPDEIAENLGVSNRTIQRDLDKVRLLLVSAEE